MKKYIILFSWIFLVSCKDNQQQPINQISNAHNSFEFTEIGNKKIHSAIFPAQWNVHIYEESPVISKKDSLLQSTLDNLDYFNQIKGKIPTNIDIYSNVLKEKNQKIDSLFVIDSLSNGNKSFVYVKTVKTLLLDNNYDFPPKINEIDLLIYVKSKFKEKLSIYSQKNYPFAVNSKLGYFDKQGNLILKNLRRMKKALHLLWKNIKK